MVDDGLDDEGAGDERGPVIPHVEPRILAAWREWLSALAGEETGAELGLLRKMPLAQQRRRILAWLRTSGVPGVGFDQVEIVRSLLATGPGVPAKVNLPGNWHARRRAKRLFLERAS